MIVGAILFGTGWRPLAIAPPPALPRGEGRRDAMVGVVGIRAGALVYVAAFAALQGLVNGFGNLGEVTLPALTGVSPWIFLSALAIAAFLVTALVQRRAEQH